MPGYKTVNAFLQVRPIERVVVSLNVDNLFNTLAITSVFDGSLPASGVTSVQTLYGRTVRAAIRFYI
jgi:outer membrane receptor protein involved in Fe transport